MILLLAVTLNGLAAARLCRRLGAAPAPALLVGLFAQVLPFVTNELGVLQLVMVFPLLYVADAILAWADEATWPRGLAIGAWLSVTFLTCGYYGLFAIVVLGPAALVLVRRDWLTLRRLGQLASAAGLFAALCGPILIGQSHYTSAYTRPDSVILANSAQPHHWYRLNEVLPGQKVEFWLSDEGGEQLFPGTVVLWLAIAGACLVVAGPVGGRWRGRAALFCGTGIAIAFVLSLGLHLSILGWHPYELVRARVPGFAELRSPFRAAVLVQALLLPLAGVTLDRLWSFVRSAPVADSDEPAAAAVVLDKTGNDETPGASEREPVVAAVAVGAGVAGTAGGSEPPARTGPPLGDDPETPLEVWSEDDRTPEPAPGDEPVPARRGRFWWLAVALTVLAIVEVWPVPQKLVDAPTIGTGTDWVDFLAAQTDPGHGDGSVVMLPFPTDRNYISFEDTTRWMLAGLDHGHPLLNGYSGLFPPEYERLNKAVNQGFPNEEAINIMAEYHVSWVVAPPQGKGTDELAAWQSWGDVLQPVFQGEDKIVYVFWPPGTP